MTRWWSEITGGEQADRVIALSNLAHIADKLDVFMSLSTEDNNNIFSYLKEI